MRASLDTNVIIHLYRAGLQEILFDIFTDGVFIYEQIRNVELENHGKDVIPDVDKYIADGKIELYTDAKLKEQGVYKVFEYNVKDNRLLYNPGDMGEVYAISLAQTIGAYSLVTDDTKPGGPYMSLLQLEYDVMPFNFADILILRYLFGMTDEVKTISDFNLINETSDLKWTFRAQVKKFVKRFITDPYKDEDKQWIEQVAKDKNISMNAKIKALGKML